MSFVRALKAAWSGRNDVAEPAPRQLHHPRDLQVGDSLCFDFLPIPDLSQMNFQVAGVCDYDFGGALPPKTVFTLDNGGIRTVYLAVIKERGVERLEVSTLIERPVVESLFDPQAFAVLFDPHDPAGRHLHCSGEALEATGWTAAHYHQEGVFMGYIQGRPAAMREGGSPDDASEISYMPLMSPDRRYGVQIEVHAGGRTTVALAVYLPVDAVRELWPTGQRR